MSSLALLAATLGGGLHGDVPVDPALYANGSCPENNPSWYQPPICESDIRELSAAGFNTVRLLVHWSQVEPKPGQYDELYLSRIDQLIDWAEDSNVGVLVDFHQVYMRVCERRGGHWRWALVL